MRTGYHQRTAISITDGSCDVFLAISTTTKSSYGVPVVVENTIMSKRTPGNQKNLGSTLVNLTFDKTFDFPQGMLQGISY